MAHLFTGDPMAVRKIIRIDESKCNGCGKCVDACAEGAIEIRDGKARIVKVDVDQNQQTAMKYHVRSIPMLLVFKNGQVQNTQIGAVGKAQLAQLIDKAL